MKLLTLRSRSINPSIFKGIVLALSLGGAFACKTRQEGSGALAAGGGAGAALELPTPGTTKNAISAADQKSILGAWNKVKDTYYDPNVYNFDFPPASANFTPPTSAETVRCLGACPDYYSSLVCHFYCWHPSYAQVSPNVRGCVTSIARGAVQFPGTPNRSMYYPEIYDYCVYQPFDAVVPKIDPQTNTPEPFPTFDQATIDANAKANNRVGVLKWVDENERDVFRYLMFTHYEPGTYSVADQQAIINKFYGVDLGANTSYGPNDQTEIAACKNRPRVPAEPQDGTHCSYTMDVSGFQSHDQKKHIVEFMKSYLAQHKSGVRTPSVPNSPPASVAFALKSGKYSAVKGKNKDCTATVGNKRKSKGVLSTFNFTFSRGCYANNHKLRNDTTVYHFTDCGDDNICDSDIDDDGNSEVSVQIKADDRFMLKYHNEDFRGQETWQQKI